jgi:hypothetical protein
MNCLLNKYTEFVYGIYKNVYKMYTKRILSIYRFLIGLKALFIILIQKIKWNKLL